MKHPAKHFLPLFLCFCLAAVCLVPAWVATANSADAPARITLNILSDLHYLPLGSSGGQGGGAAQALRLSAESAPAAEEALSTVIRNRPEALLITGDLTNNGERQSAEALADQLRRVERAGIPVYVINGDSDTGPGGLTPSEFRSIFREFGYDGADGAVYYQPLDTGDQHAKQGGLSYAVTPKPGIRLLMIDNEDDPNNRSSVSGGILSDGLMEWVLRQVKQAEKKGETVFAGMHRPLLPHKSDTPAEALNGVVDHGGEAAKRFADAGLPYLFTGHMHETDVAKYTSPAGNWLLEMETGSLVTYGAPIRTAIVEGAQITLRSESVKEINWQGRRVSYPARLKEQLYSDTAFVDYILRFLENDLRQLEANGIKHWLEQRLPTGGLDSAIRSALKSALRNPVTLDLGGKWSLGSFVIRFDGADTVTIESSAARLLPPLQLTVTNHLSPMLSDLLAQMDAQWLAKGADGQSRLQREMELLLTRLCGSALGVTPDGKNFTVNDFLTDMMLVHAVGQEAPDAQATEILNGLRDGLTRALLSEQLLPGASALGQELLDGLKLNTADLSDGAGALWKPTFKLLSSMRVGSLAKLAGFSVDEALQKALTDQRAAQLSSAVFRFASGFYVDTEGIDDRVDGTGVQYTNGVGVALTAQQDVSEATRREASTQSAAAPDSQPPASAAQTLPAPQSTAAPEGSGTAAPPTAAGTRNSGEPVQTAAVAAAASPSTWSAILFMAAAAFAVSDYRRL